jgi:adenylate cyclase
MAFEIERKFLLDRFPEELIEQGSLEFLSRHRIEQTYLVIVEDEELRVRRLVHQGTGVATYTMTYKKGHGKVREEHEHHISEWMYQSLTSQYRKKPLVKERTVVRDRETGIIIEIDRYTHLSLIVAEVEFSSKEEADSFKAPAWFGDDISGNIAYSNKQLFKQLNA